MLHTASADKPSLDKPRLRKALPGLLVAAALTAALGAAMVGPATVGGPTAPPPSTIVAQRTLNFLDRADGAVIVTENGAQIAVFEGEQGFLRGILRSMARQRRGEGLAATQPFHLAAWADGRITLDDLASGERVELEAFGPTNAAVFTSLLPAR